MPKVAIITRTKDRPVFLKRAIKSVSDQVYTDYVHIIMNDGGDIGAIDSLVAEQAKDSRERIKIFHREQSSGAPDTLFNEAIKKTTSDYIAIHDDDDTWHPEFLLRTVAELDKGAEGVVVRTDNVYERNDGNVITKIKTSRYMPDVQAISLYRQCLDNQLTAVAFAYSRKAYEEVGGYDDTLPVVGDWEFGIRFLMKYDVNLIDPGFALAFYHRRLEADNSFKEHDHRKNITKVFNKYLRQELAEGRLGVGYIMNDLRYEQDMIANSIRKLLPKSVAGIIRKRIR